MELYTSYLLVKIGEASALDIPLVMSKLLYWFLMWHIFSVHEDEFVKTKWFKKQRKYLAKSISCEKDETGQPKMCLGILKQKVISWK